MKEINYVSPFKKFCITIGNLPTAYIESMSYYEGLTYLVNYLSNNVIPALNHNGEVVEELQNQFTILKNYVDNYFDNLDVQEEINNKLDDMAESGQLTDIIAQYLGLAGMLTFDNVADMKLAENLVNGSKCQTLGYNIANDGGTAIYKVRTINNDDVVDEMLIIALYNPTLVAELIFNSNEINPCQFGAKHNGIDDDTAYLQACLDILHTKNFTTLDLKEYTYYISAPLHLDSNYKATIKNGEIKALDSFVLDDNTSKNYLLYLTDTIETGNIGTYAQATQDLSIQNVKFDAGLIDGLGCLKLTRYLRININNCYFRRYKTNGLYIDSQQSHELNLNNSIFNGCLYNETNTTGIGINLDSAKDNIFTNLIITDSKYGIKMTSCVANTFSKIHTYGMTDYGINTYEGAQNTFEQIYFDGNGIYMYKPWQTTFINCYFLVNTTPITLDKPAGDNNAEIYGLKFIGCVGNNYDSPDTTIDMITYPNGNFKLIHDSEFDITMAGSIYNNLYSAIGFNESQNNQVFINSQNATLLLNQTGVITNENSMSDRYTATMVNNVIDVTAYNSTGYTWAGIVIPLSKNTKYKTINLYNHSQNYKIYGFSSLAASSVGTEIKSQNINSHMYTIFDSGNYDYYVLSFYDKKIIIPDIRTL